MYSEKENEEREKRSANISLSEIEAAMILAKNNDFGCEIHISGLVIGISVNEHILPLLEYEKGEIEKYLRGEPNTYE